LRLKVRSASAVATFLPRMSWATRFSFCDEMRIMLVRARASVSLGARSCLGLPIASGPLGLLVGRVAMERPRRRELAELVADHVLADEHGDVLVAVMDAEGHPDELRQDGRAPAPDLDHLATAAGTGLFGLAQHEAVDEGAFPN